MPYADPVKAREKGVERQRRYREARTGRGICSSCDSREIVPGLKVCAACREANRVAMLNRYANYRAHRICVACGQAPATASRHCDACWFINVARKTVGNRARAAEIRQLFDAQGGRCVYTGDVLVPGVNASLDHKVPQARGGGHEINNLQWVVREVNHAKNAMSERDFLGLVRRIASHTRKPTAPPAGPRLPGVE